MGNDSSFSAQFSAVSPPPPLFLSAGKKYNFSLSPPRQICHLSRKDTAQDRTDRRKEKKLAGKVTANEANINHPSKKSPSKSEREENEREKSFKL